jgi:hypothetical protein
MNTMEYFMIKDKGHVCIKQEIRELKDGSIRLIIRQTIMISETEQYTSKIDFESVHQALKYYNNYNQEDAELIMNDCLDLI